MSFGGNEYWINISGQHGILKVSGGKTCQLMSKFFLRDHWKYKKQNTK